jgi:hypothetical protein
MVFDPETEAVRTRTRRRTVPHILYETQAQTNPQELVDFYGRLRYEIGAEPQQIRSMVSNSDAFVTARSNGRLIGVARGICDGVRGYLTECKLDPEYQGPGAITRTDGRIEHDEHGIAAEMARRVLDKLAAEGVRRVDVVAWGTEVDFLEELGFKRQGGLVGMTMKPGSAAAVAAQAQAI